jgi:hypothetical protein
MGGSWSVTTSHTRFLRKDRVPKFVQYKMRPSFQALQTCYFATAPAAPRK